MNPIAFITFNCDRISFSEHGEANGYVAVPPGHPAHGKHYDALGDLYVHGGVTFAALFKGDFEAQPSGSDADWIVSRAKYLMPNCKVPAGWWVIGFDTYHSGDDEKVWPAYRVAAETVYLEHQLNAMR